MKKKMAYSVLGLALGTACIATAAAQTEPDRNSLPIPEPQTKNINVSDVRNAAPPERFEGKSPARAPNIVIILADDMGFSDMGSFGSEIKTPNFDSLAKDGVRFTNFYTHASSSPTRSMLLSGVDTHLNGLGNMDEMIAPNQWGVDGYEGNLNNKVVTLPQLLKDAGYHTYMVGQVAHGQET